MKRFFFVFLSVILCILLCVNVAFADTVTNNTTSNVTVYFPFFGGLNVAGSNLTTTANVTHSDVIEIGTSTLDQVFNGTMGYDWSSGGYVRGNGNKVDFNITGSAYVAVARLSLISGHKYLYYSDDFKGTTFVLSTSSSYNDRFFSSSSSCILDNSNSDVYVIFRVPSGLTVQSSVYFNVIDVTNIFGAGNEPSSVDDVIFFISDQGYSFPVSPGSYNLFPITQFSLVPITGIFAQVSSMSSDDNTFNNMSITFDIDILEEVVLDTLGGSTFELDSVTQSSGGIWTITGSLDGTTVNVPAPQLNWTGLYAHQDYNGKDYTMGGSAYMRAGIYNWFSYNPDLNFSNVTINRSGGSDTSSSTGTADHDLDTTGDITGSGNGTITFSRVVTTTDRTYFLYNNNVNMGTYDFNINVKFPTLEKFNNFSGLWFGSFYNSWGEVFVRTQIQEVSSNADSLIKIYKLTFDVPFTGSYTHFNIKYFGGSDAFTTMRVDASVIDPNAYLNGVQVDSLAGLGSHLTSLFDKLWGKLRSLFFDQDQTMQESIPSELAEQNNTVRSGTDAIHNFETQTFDNIDQTQESIDWVTPDSFGSVDSSGSAIGFVASIFTSFFNSIGSNMQNIIVIPLVLGLVLVVLGRGQMALGRALSAPKSKPKGGRK